MPTDSLLRKYEELSTTLQAYRAAVNVAAIVSVTDTSGRIIYVNEKFIEISKYSSADLIGNTHRILNSGHHPPEFFKEMWETISHGKPWRGEIKNKARDGTYYWIDSVITPVLDKNGQVFQYLAVFNLVTVQKEHEEQLIAVQSEMMIREQQLKDAQRVAKTGSWYMNIVTNIVDWSEETYRIYELPVGTIITSELYSSLLHPDDRENVEDCWQEGLTKGLFEIDHRIVTPAGEKWVSERGHFEFNDESRAVSAIGTVQDITEKKRTENILRESESQYKSLFNDSPFANGILDKETLKCLEINNTALALYGYSREEFLQLTAFDLRPAEDHDKIKQQLDKGLFGADRTIRAHRKKNGEIIQVEPFISEISYKGKQAFLITIHDVTENLQLQEQLIRSRMNRQHEISRASMEAQEKYRAEVGRELHDNVNQLLAVTHLCLKNIQPAAEADKKLIDKGIQATVAAIKEIRKLSWSLVPPALADLSLHDSIENLALDFKLTGVIVDLDIKIFEELIREGLKINIYRIIQEQFSNIIKYAQAKKVKLSMEQQNGKLTLEIADDGKGFDPKQKAKGIGLNNIIHRAEAYNGEVTIESSTGHGCRVFIEFRL
ncbi:MAG: PAS domain S-box protein [Bacteroidetes bacterium]|jgi:PAS domain S-box-containing protein|nr:MAG: PAS domain S-box protein [Bacteroidota bacterium]